MYRARNFKTKNNSGFTLIELMVVVSIITLLSSILLVTIVHARLNARIAVREQNLTQLQKALELYYNDHGAYPATDMFNGSIFGRGERDWQPNYTGSNTYIPDLAPRYLSTLPKDELMGTVPPSCPGGFTLGYQYVSDGTDYKIYSSCGTEGTPLPSNSQYRDPTGHYTWYPTNIVVYTPNAAGWCESMQYPFNPQVGCQ